MQAQADIVTTPIAPTSLQKLRQDNLKSPLQSSQVGVLAPPSSCVLLVSSIYWVPIKSHQAKWALWPPPLLLGRLFRGHTVRMAGCSHRDEHNTEDKKATTALFQLPCPHKEVILLCFYF